MFLSADDTRSIAKRLLSRSRADDCVVSIEGGEEQSLRFARGSATTNISAAKLTLHISSHIGGRIGSVSTASLDEDAQNKALARSEEIARLLPVDPDYMPPLGPQTYAPTRRYDAATATLGFDTLAAQAGEVIAEGARRNVESFGCAASWRNFSALATSRGLFAYDRHSEIELSATARNRSDSWSGWAGAHAHRLHELDVGSVARRACDKAAYDAEPVDLDPGRYTVVMEPEATAELARWLLNSLNARKADEGRSFFSRKGGGSRVLEPLFDSKLTLHSGPDDDAAPEGSIGYEGVPHESRLWIDKGVLSCLYRSRVWAKKTNSEAIPHPRAFTVQGGETALDDMIRTTKRGVLVTRFWYTNMVDPRSLLLTGLTRDGNFLIEDGRIVAPARNLRFNESLAALFARIEALGPSEATHEGASAPPMLVEGFNFSSKSSGI